jgi:sulfatase modifying factor 1
MTTLLNEWNRLVGLLVLAGVSLLGCATTAVEGAGSETHFACMADADCTTHGGSCVARECRIAGDASTGGVIGTGGVTSNGGASGTGGTPPAGCPTGLAGPRLVEIPAPQGGTYCMDATEVTNAQYAQFVTAKGTDGGTDVSGQDTWCTWNTTYTPSLGWPATGKDAYPVVWVDWCDACAYCKWAGKHLCGKIGGEANLYADYADATKSEWFNACSKGGTQTYPYGSAYSGSACNGNSAAFSVGSTAMCEGGYAGLFDLSGNVTEWEDSCNGTTGTYDACRLRGGSLFSNDPALACGSDYGIGPRDLGNDYVGFRCCGTSL